MCYAIGFGGERRRQGQTVIGRAAKDPSRTATSPSLVVECYPGDKVTRSARRGSDADFVLHELRKIDSRLTRRFVHLCRFARFAAGKECACCTSRVAWPMIGLLHLGTAKIYPLSVRDFALFGFHASGPADPTTPRLDNPDTNNTTYVPSSTYSYCHTRILSLKSEAG